MPTYTRIDIIGGEECRVTFETLREAVQKPPAAADSRLLADATIIAKPTAGLSWRSTGMAMPEERAAIDTRSLRARLAEALGLSGPSDDELVEVAARLSLSVPDEAPALTNAPLPEGREGESIVVYGVWDETPEMLWDTTASAWVDGVSGRIIWPDDSDGVRWAYVTRSA